MTKVKNMQFVHIVNKKSKDQPSYIVNNEGKDHAACIHIVNKKVKDQLAYIVNSKDKDRLDYIVDNKGRISLHI